MTLTASEVSSLTETLTKWEYAEYFFTALVAVACLGEYLADFTKIWARRGLWMLLGPIEYRKERFAKLSTLVLVSALALELLCLVRTNQLSGLVIGSLDERSNEAMTKSGKALGDSTTALSQSSTAKIDSAKAVGESGRALREADSFENDIASAKKQASEAEVHLGEAVSVAKAEEAELIKLEKQVAPRVLTPEQQRSIATALRGFSGRVVDVSTYGLDGEGAAVGTQILSVLISAGIKPVDGRAQTIVTGGFDFGVHVRGPASEQPFVLAIADALSSIGRLQVWTNKGMVRPGAQLTGNATIGGAAAMSGGGGPPGPDGPTPQGTPVTIFVGIKPVEVILAR